MNGSSLIKKIIFSSWFLAVIPAIVIILFIPPLGSKYKLLVEEVDKTFLTESYVDLNSDSISEIICPVKGLPYYYIVVMNNDHKVYDQWNLMDNADPTLSGSFIGNFDNDSFSEIYIFTYKGDSLFININEFLEPKGTRLDRVYITKIGFLKGIVTSKVRHAGFFDNDGDGKAELYFSIQTGYGLEPRLLYCFDIVHKELKTSQFTGVICQNPSMSDIDGDNKPEIYGIVGASGNYKIRPPYTDSSTWLMVFNENLKFEFPPVEFPGLTNILETKAYANGDFKGYISSYNTGSADTSVLKPRIMLFSTGGKMIRDRSYFDLGLKPYPWLTLLKQHNSDRVFLLGNQLLEINDKLEVINKAKSPFHSVYTFFWADINFDNKDELVLYSDNEEKLVVYNSELRRITEAELKADRLVLNTSYYSSRNHEQKVFLTSSENAYYIKLIKNNYYFLEFLAYPGIYLLLFLFIELLNKINTFKVVQKEGLQRRLVTLQLQGIKSQLDPHFTFNTLNSVASLIYLEDRESAYDYLIKFTELLRGMLNDAERIYRSLSEELQFLTTYLDLEKLRFGEKFCYTIEIGEGLSQKELVPKLVLQTFAENAIKHGLMPKSEGGILKIRADRENDYLKLTVEDNGVGRATTAGHSASTGKGLKITGEFYEILNQINKRPIKHLITDLYNERGRPAGTRIEVWVPLDLSPM